jgi:hypothetical protein
MGKATGRCPPSIRHSMGKVKFALLGAAILLTSSCLNLNAFPVMDGSVASARDDGGAVNPNDQTPPQSPDAPQTPPPDAEAVPPPPMDGCQIGFHSCSGTCVDSKLPGNCGVACTPCPTIAGGDSTCDGVKCGVQCPAGKKPCIDSCVDEGAACEDKCPAGKNPCNGICVDRSSVSTCGTACVTCPTSPNGQTACDGDKCVLACSTGYHACGNTCASNTDPLTCGTGCTPCPIPAGGSATCDGTKCGTSCPANTKICNGECIDQGKACDGSCPTGKHNCNGNCVSNNDTANCGTSCMPCQPPANGQATCNGTTCGFTCQSGSHRCGDECKDNRSVDSCGTSSCNSCPTSPSATATCDGAKCDLKCNGTLHLCSDGVCRECCSDSHCTGQGNKTTCKNGACVSTCSPGASCNFDKACRAGKIACENGAPVCTDGGPDDGKAGCATGNHCKNGACVADCVAGGACSYTARPCHAGRYSCDTGVQLCVDAGADDSKAGCGSGFVCSGGQCIEACRPDQSCNDGVGACQRGVTTCASSTSPAKCKPVADDSKNNCQGANQKCQGGACVLSCPSSQYKEGNACLDKKGLEGNCSKNEQCQTNFCIAGPGTDGVRCCNPGQVTCDGFCVEYDGDESCVNPADSNQNLNFCDTSYGIGFPCDANSVKTYCSINNRPPGPWVLNVYRYTKSAFTQKSAPTQVTFCCPGGQRGGC